MPTTDDDVSDIIAQLRRLPAAAGITPVSSAATGAIISSLNQSIGSAFATMRAQLMRTLAATVSPSAASAIGQTMANTLRSTQALLRQQRTTVGNSSRLIDGAVDDAFARTAIDVKTLLHSVAAAADSAGADSGCGVDLLARAIAVVHAAAQRHTAEHPCTAAIGSAAAAIDALRTTTTAQQASYAAALFGVIRDYSLAVHGATERLSLISIDGRVVRGPGPQLRSLGAVPVA